MTSRLALAAALVGSTLGPAVARAQMQHTTLLVNTNPHSLYVYDGLHFGGGVWQGTTAGIMSSFAGVGTTETLLDLSNMMQYDALWVDQRYQSAPTATELSNLRAYAATGRHVVVMGENATWGPWNDAVLEALGGDEGVGQTQAWYWANGHVAEGCLDGPAFTAVRSPLTDGVNSINMACGGYAIGGTALFDYNVATLWGPHQNVLTVLDGNVFDDRFISAGGVRFRQNVLDWLSDPIPSGVPIDRESEQSVGPNVMAAAMRRGGMVAMSDVRATATPEPATLALVGGGLLALAAAARRRRSTSGA